MIVPKPIDKFIAENGGNERDALNVAITRLEAAEKQLASDAWKFDSEAMAKVIFDKSIEEQAQARLDAFIKHEREQRRFIAANSAMNGLLAGQYYTHNQPKIATRTAMEFADALLAELETTNLQTQQQ